MSAPYGAAITAGGASRRFGRDKALHVWRGRSLLEHVAESLKQAHPKVLIAPEGKYRLPGWRVVPDQRPGLGPLAGLEAALAEGQACGTPRMAFSAVDLPGLSGEYWEHLAASSPGAAITCPLDPRGRPQPLAAIYATGVLPVVRGLLDAGERRMMTVLDRCDTSFVPWEELAGFGPLVLTNANTPRELP